MKSSQILTELVIATLAASLWVTPRGLTLNGVEVGRLMRATGYSTSVVFFGKAYLMLVLNYGRFKIQEEKEEIESAVDLELHEYKKASELNLKRLEIDKEMLEKSAPLLKKMQEIEQGEPRQHPEISEAEREQAAKNAIESALCPPTKIQNPKSTSSDQTEEVGEK